MEASDHNRALQYYKEAFKLKPKFADAYHNLGNVCKSLGIPQEANVCYLCAFQAITDNVMAFGNVAGIYYEDVVGQLKIMMGRFFSPMDRSRELEM